MPLLSTQTDDAATPQALGQEKANLQSVSPRHGVVRYKPYIDGLRALAIIAVVAFHAFPSVVPGGFVGVDVFLVISGFLISNILLEGLEHGTFAFGSFYANRIRRLFPALLVVLTVSFALGWFLLLPDEYQNLGKHVVGAATYIENIVLLRESGYFDVRSSFKPLMHLWSLGIEEQFYLSYPLFLWAMWRFRRNMFGVLVGIATLSFVRNVAQVRHDSVGAFLLPHTRCWELTIGCAIACWQFQSGQQRGAMNRLRVLEIRRYLRSGSAWIGNGCSAIGIALILLAVVLFHDTDPFPGWRASLPVFGTALIVIAGSKAWMNRTVLANKALVFIGLLSYPLYLWHWPVLAFLRILRGGEVSVRLRIVAVILSFALAWITFRFVERPIRFGRKNSLRPLSLVAASIVLASFGFAATRDGFVSRFPEAVSDLGHLRDVVWSTPGCREVSGLSKIDYCRSTSGKRPDILLIGDSHAAVLYDGLAPFYQQRSLSLMNLGEAGCAPFYDTKTFPPGSRNQDCSGPVNAMIAFAVHEPAIRTIIFSARGPRYMSGDGFGAVDSRSVTKRIWWVRLPQTTPQPEMYAETLHNTLSLLNASGKKVVLLVDWPELGFDPRSCLTRPFDFLRPASHACSVSKPEVEKRNRSYREQIVRLEREFPKMEVFDPLPYLCDSASCYGMRDGHLLYSDDNHISVAGARYLASAYFNQQ